MIYVQDREIQCSSQATVGTSTCAVAKRVGPMSAFMVYFNSSETKGRRPRDRSSVTLSREKREKHDRHELQRID